MCDFLFEIKKRISQMNKSCQDIVFILPKLFKVFLFIVCFSAYGEAMDEGFKVDVTTLKPGERIEFGFVLLPDESTRQAIQELANASLESIKDLPGQHVDPNWGDYVNKVVTLPHVSLGQYGLLAIECPTLFEIVREIAEEFSPFKESMAEVLFATSENIFFDFQNIKGDTNPKIVGLYKMLREEYMSSLTTKFHIAQALLERLTHRLNLEELSLLDTCYQNWGTPEGNRIRPHFTLVYNYTPSLSEASAAVKKISIPDSLKTIVFNRLGIVQIDVWGNPTRLLYETKLTD
jgi:hypothetical protein